MPRTGPCCTTRQAITAAALVLWALSAAAAGGPRYGAGYHARQAAGLRPLSNRSEAQALRAPSAANQADCTGGAAASSPAQAAVDRGSPRGTPSSQPDQDGCIPARPASPKHPTEGRP